MTVEELTKRLDEARGQRQVLVEQAQYQLGAMDGQIAFMERMLSEMSGAEKIATVPSNEHGS